MTAVAVPVDERQRWRSALDAFAGGLAASRQALAASDAANVGSSEGPSTAESGTSGPKVAWPPAELPSGPVPEGMRAEAESLLAQADALRSQILAEMDRSRPTGRRSSTPVSASPRWSMHL